MGICQCRHGHVRRSIRPWLPDGAFIPLMPDPFGMRWFGIFVFWLIIAFAGAVVSPWGGVIYPAVIAIVGLSLIAIDQASATAHRWLMGHWR